MLKEKEPEWFFALFYLTFKHIESLTHEQYKNSQQKKFLINIKISQAKKVLNLPQRRELKPPNSIYPFWGAWATEARPSRLPCKMIFGAEKNLRRRQYALLDDVLPYLISQKKPSQKVNEAFADHLRWSKSFRKNKKPCRETAFKKHLVKIIFSSIFRKA